MTLNPAIDDPTVFIAARQTFGAGPTVTVHTQPTSLVEGPPPGDSTYVLPLPSDAPLLGQYSQPLPIALVAQGPLAGMYAIRGAAEGYATQSFNVDVSGGDVVQDFALVP